MNFILDFEIPEKKDKSFENNAYATFCVNFVDSIKDLLNFSQTEITKLNNEKVEVKALRIKMDIPAIKIKSSIHPVIERKNPKIKHTNPLLLEGVKNG